MAGNVSVTGGEGRRPVVVPLVLAVSIALNIALLGVLALNRGGKPDVVSSPAIDKAAFYTVFLDNKEAFVGHITDINATEISMEKLYYLTFQANDAAGNPIANPKADDFKPVLKKLGQELWGPKDFVRIDRAKVEYYVELRPDSQVVQAIAKFEQGKPAPAPAPTSPPAPTSSPKPTPSPTR